MFAVSNLGESNDIERSTLGFNFFDLTGVLKVYSNSLINFRFFTEPSVFFISSKTTESYL